MQEYYKINEIANFFNINTSTIRYYEQYGLLTPAYINTQTKYRYYDLDNIYTISYIMELRHSGMSMDSIKKYLLEDYSREAFIKELEYKKDSIERLIRINKEEMANSKKYNISIVNINDSEVYEKEYFALNYEQIIEYTSDFLSLAIKNSKIINSSSIYIEYDSLIPKFTDIKMKVGIESLKTPNTILRKKYKAIKTIHKGTYETLNNAYEALVEYAKKNNINLKGTAIEYYLESFNLRKNPEDNLTIVLLPILE